jgi:hypothetical protein
VRSAAHAYEDRFHNGIFENLPAETRERLDALLRPENSSQEDEQGESTGKAPALLLKLRASPGRPSLASVQDEFGKLEAVRSINIPDNLFSGVPSGILERCRQRVVVEVPGDLRKHPDAPRLTWLAAFTYLRSRSLTDDLVDVLIETIHQIGARAERKVEKQFTEDMKRVTEAILRRFTKHNVQHPTYKALAELGKAIKTIFLCHYLHEEALRREINEGLNVVEQWNGATDFVFFARKGELSSNRREDHEISMLALHLIQNCMVYVNTLMIQKVLAQPHWQGRMTPRDYAALTPLIWEHVNPYGKFELDMEARIDLA